MTSAQSILIGACIIAAAIFVSQGVAPAKAASGGPYQLMQHSNVTANVGVFRIDTSSGDVSYCFLTASSDLTCTKPVH